MDDSETLSAILELLDERLPKGKCGDVNVTVDSAGTAIYRHCEREMDHDDWHYNTEHSWPYGEVVSHYAPEYDYELMFNALTDRIEKERDVLEERCIGRGDRFVSSRDVITMLNDLITLVDEMMESHE